jgi:type II secretory pathway pseudopilin PulG
MTCSTTQKNVTRQAGFTLIELVVTILIAAIPIVAVGILLSGASRGWQQIYNETNSPIRQDAAAVMASLQNFGRQANILNYQIYTIKSGVYGVATAPVGQNIASGQAVEFRYWKTPFNPASPGADELNVDNTGTHYALYYLDNNELKVDLGQVVGGVGGVSGNSRKTGNIISTQTLAQNVDLAKTTNLFSHTIVAGMGHGCVNTVLTLTNNEGVTIEIMFATMLRSAWPR